MSSKKPKFEETEEITEVPKFEDTMPMSEEAEVADPNEMSDEDFLKSIGVKPPKDITKRDVSEFESGARGFAQEFSFSFADEIEAGLRSLGGLTGDYKSLRDNIRKEYKEAEEANPKSFMTGQGAGMLASLYTGIRLAGTGAKGAAKLAQKGMKPETVKALQRLSKDSKVVNTLKNSAIGASGGYASGLTRGLGESEKETIAEALEDAKSAANFEAKIGGLLPIVGSVLKGTANLAKKSGQVSKQAADAAQLRSMGISNLKKMGLTNKMGKDETKELARFARDNDLVSYTLEDTLDKTTKLRTSALDDLIAVQKKVKGIDRPIINKDIALKQLDNLIKENKLNIAKEIRVPLEKIKRDMLNARSNEDWDKLYKAIGAKLRNRSVDNQVKGAMAKVFADLSQNIDNTLIKAGEEINEPLLKELYRETNKNFRFANKLATAAEDEAASLGRKEYALTSSDAGRVGAFGPKSAGIIYGVRVAASALPVATAKARKEVETLRKSMTKSGREKEAKKEALQDLLNKIKKEQQGE